MKRSQLIKDKEIALDKMRLCMSVFHGNKPPLPHHCVEMQAHAALVMALCAELGPPLPMSRLFEDNDPLTVAVASLDALASDNPHRRKKLQEIAAQLRAMFTIGGDA